MSRELEQAVLLEKSLSLSGRKSRIESQESVEEESISFKRLDHQESLKAVFKLLAWVCKNSKFAENDKIIIMQLLFDLLQEILRICTVNEMHELVGYICQDESHLLNQLFFEVLRLGAAALHSRLQQFLDTIIEPKQFHSFLAVQQNNNN